MDQHLRPLDMAKELMAEPVAFMRAFDQTGNVGDDEAAIAAQRDDAKIWRQRREWIVGNLRPRRGNHRDECRLARVRKSHESDIRQQLQREMQIERFAGLAGLMLARRAIGRRRKVRVAQPAASALREPDALTNSGEVRYLIELAALRI